MCVHERRSPLFGGLCAALLFLASLLWPSSSTAELAPSNEPPASAPAPSTEAAESDELPELDEKWAWMNQKVRPFHMTGNLFYVGASSVTAFLITTPEGHVLIDGGFEQTGPRILENIKRLGYKLEDVRWILNSHAHFDHAGGLAAIKEATGAKLAANKKDAPILERGGTDDDVFGDDLPFPAVTVDRLLADGDEIKLGGVTFVAHETPGHTRGCTTWEFNVTERRDTFRAVSVCSLSVLEEMQLEGEETYPGIKGDFERSFAKLEKIEAELFLASHGGFFSLEDKWNALQVLPHQSVPSANPYVDPEGYREYLNKAREKFDKKLAAERNPDSGEAASEDDS